VIFVMGLCLMIQLAGTNTLLQTMAPPFMLGRVMSMFAIANNGGMPVGAFLEGLIAERAGAIHTLAGAGVLVVIAALTIGRASINRPS
jgi:predicted MFS family arabinose efflux permease